MNKYTLYIGADNVTKQIDYAKLDAVLSSHFDGYTIVDSIGLWQGKPEKSVVVTIFASLVVEKLEIIIQQLIEELDQTSILLEFNNNGTLIYKK